MYASKFFEEIITVIDDPGSLSGVAGLAQGLNIRDPVWAALRYRNDVVLGQYAINFRGMQTTADAMEFELFKNRHPLAQRVGAICMQFPHPAEIMAPLSLQGWLPMTAVQAPMVKTVDVLKALGELVAAKVAPTPVAELSLQRPHLQPNVADIETGQRGRLEDKALFIQQLDGS
jgi:hypothetical protein